MPFNVLVLGIAEENEYGNIQLTSGQVMNGLTDFSFDNMRVEPVYFEGQLPGSGLRAGEYGVAAAHRSAWHECANSGADACVIMERDAVLVSDHHEVFSDMNNVVTGVSNGSADIGFLGHCHGLCTHGYVLKPSSALELINKLPSEENMTQPVDFTTLEYCNDKGERCIFAPCASFANDDELDNTTAAKDWGHGCMRQDRSNDKFENTVSSS